MARTIAVGKFEWEREKAWLNLAKHKVSFEEAITVFDDAYFFAYKDLKHSPPTRTAMLSSVFLSGTGS